MTQKFIARDSNSFVVAMPGLSFLNKKSFHTTNVKNVEKVWLAEKKAAEEQKRLAELQKQLQEERQILELRQLQAAQGQSTKVIDNSLDWMYEGPMSSSQKQQTSEEYLLGKIYKPQAESSKDALMPGMPGQDQAAPKWLNKVASKNDSFARAHEDPFIMIKQEENKRREKIISNPIKMDRIKQKIESELEEKEREKRLKKQHKKEKKEQKKAAKKQRKESKSSKRDRGSSSSEGSSSESEREGGDRRASVDGRGDDRSSGTVGRDQGAGDRRPEDGHRPREDSRDRERYGAASGRREDSRDHRETSRDTGANRVDGDRRRRSPSRSNSRDRRGDSRPNRSGEAGDSGRDRQGRRDRHSRERYAPERRDDRGDRDGRDGGRDTGRDATNNRREDSDTRRREASRRSPSRSRSRSRSSDSRGRDRARGEDQAGRKRQRGGSSDRDESSGDRKRYGLIRNPNNSSNGSSNGSSNRNGSGGHLGPNPELLRRREEAERKAEAERRNRTRADVSSLSAEEKQRRLREMQEDAERNDAIRASRISVKASGANDTAGADNTGHAAFLQSMRKEVYSTTSSADMSKRIDQNKYSRQSAADIDSADGFIRR